MNHSANPILHLQEAAAMGKLVVVVGTGVSMALTDNKIAALSWKGLIRNGFDYAVTKGRMSDAQRQAWQIQLSSDDLDELLSAADFMIRKLSVTPGDLYARWLENVFKHVRPESNEMKQAISGLSDAGIPICTLNYDPLLEHTTGLPAIHLGDTTKVSQWMRGELKAILHLHGFWSDPDSCILGVQDYESAIGDEVRELIQRTLTSFNRLLFIGCGDTFADPNFTALIGWLRTRMKTAALQHYALVKSADMEARNTNPYWHGFVDPISYGHEGADLPRFLLSHFSNSSSTRRKAERGPPLRSPNGSAKVLNEYRSFILRDCGQMTIEGVRADLDTAQRRFDLERLFVPLNLLAVPPEISISDPNREEKLQKWQEQHKDSVPFGRIFGKHKRLALLALPGGGKTLLLKRLAVAYADSARRTSSADGLPEMEITPVLIRCREWKAHITQPILELLQRITSITGRRELSGLDEALIPELERGKVLLLVDGLDEIHDDADRTTFVDNLEAFLSEYSDIRFVVTSREAGFALVAPTLARFCKRWRVAPLEEREIRALCHHWHKLMTGTSPEAVAESEEVASRLLENPSLKRLAENPLLLTMLLVVKHGAGRLPPDRVSLYERAVEVLLDTWNIKGHAALNPKEAVPQLAYVAYQLMREGRQTATVRELLLLLENARDNVPQIRRYANDAPDEFLKRVELRSSLLVEAGFQLDGKLAVPFYQFRHLTFQEYLAAVAVVEGHYDTYQKGDTVLTPISAYLTADEWKEVVPMAAVLARKQAEPLIAALVMEGREYGESLESDEQDNEDPHWDPSQKLPPSIARLAQCLIEEAEASPDILTEALRLILLFARGCQSQEDWSALSGGPYGEELLHQAWLLYEHLDWPRGCWLDNSFIRLANFRLARTHPEFRERKAEYTRLFASSEREDIGRGLFAMIGALWGDERADPKHLAEYLPQIERFVVGSDSAISYAATWLWALMRTRSEATQERASPVSNDIRDCLLARWLEIENGEIGSTYSFALQTAWELDRSAWKPKLSNDDRRRIANIINRGGRPDSEGNIHDKAASFILAYYDRNIVSESDLFSFGNSIPKHFFPIESLFDEALALVKRSAGSPSIGA